MLGRLVAARDGTERSRPEPPPSDLSGLEGASLARAEADERYRHGVQSWREGILSEMWMWEAAVLRASASAADVAMLLTAPLETVARALLRALTDS